MTQRPTQLAGTHTVVIRRLLPATQQDVWALWTDGARMPEWIVAGGSATLDVRVGGKYHLDMHYEGKSYPHDGEYLEVDPPRRLVFTWLSASTKWQPTIVTVELVARGNQTECIITHEGLSDPANAAGHEGGWVEILGWLEGILSTSSSRGR